MEELEVLTKRHAKKRKKLMMTLMFLVFVLMAGASYALWQITLKQTDTNILTTGCLNLTLTNDTDAITLNDAMPISDVDGKNLTPYTFTLENVCQNENSYVINLETLNSGHDVLSDNYVKSSLITDSEEVFLNKLVSRYVNEKKVIDDSINAYKLHQGKLNGNEKKTFSLRLWISDDISNMEEMMNKTFMSKITVTDSYVRPESKAVMTADIGSRFNLFDKPYVEKIVIEDKIDIPDVVYNDDVCDLSEVAGTSDDEKKVVAFLIYEEENGIFTLHIQGNGGVSAPVDSTGLFANFINLSTIDGLENFDTRNVENMSNMFYLCYTLESIDLSNFDTSKVTSMSGMFSECYKLINLDFSNFDTSSVTTMFEMFKNCTGLVSLDLSWFDTANVTNIESMFHGCSSLSSLNITGFNTLKVTI